MIKKHFHFVLAAIYFLGLTLLLTFPLILHFKDSIVGGYGDGVYFVWLIRWYQSVLLEGKGVPFFNPMMNFPEGWNLSTTDTTLASALPGVPFSALLGPIAGYNIALWITFILSGLSMYIWVHHHTKSSKAAIIAGTIYAFLPYRIAHFDAGHLNLSGTAWFPLYFMGLYGVLNSDKKYPWGYIVTTAISLGLIGLTSMYYLYFTILITIVFVLGYFIFQNWRVILKPVFWISAVITSILSIPLLFIALKPFVSLSDQGGLANRTLEYANEYSASPTDFFTFASSHFLFGKWISSVFDRSLWIESSLYIGIFSFILVILALVWKNKSEHKALIGISLLVMLTAFVLALGPSLHWNNQQVFLNLPWLGKQNVDIPLPTLLLFKYLPFFSKMRAVLRIGFFALLFAAFVAGLGANLLLRKFQLKTQYWITALLIGLVLFDFYPGSFQGSIQKIEARPVDFWLAEQPGNGAVTQMPFSKSTDQEQIFFTLTHHKPITSGFFNANQPPQFQYLAPILERFPDQKSIDTLREYQVEYILINPVDYPKFIDVETKMLQLGMELRTEQSGIRVYGFSDAP
ncbi:MAG: hypothetical protein ACYDH1_02325 [Anaerolineaceae bacterium]